MSQNASRSAVQGWLRSLWWGPQKDDSGCPFGSPEFRSHFRVRLVGERRGRVYAIAAFSLLTLIVIALARSVSPYEPHFIALFPIYFLVFNGAEYLLHRYPMHHKMKGLEMIFEHTTVHHNFFANEHYYYEEPRDYYAVILPIHVTLALSATICLLALLVYMIAGTNDALFFALTGFGYYWLYEVLHFSYHTNDTGLVKYLPFVGSLSRAHRLHHMTNLMTRYNFNITFPIFDKICGTYYKT